MQTDTSGNATDLLWPGQGGGRPTLQRCNAALQSTALLCATPHYSSVL